MHVRIIRIGKQFEPSHEVCFDADFALYCAPWLIFFNSIALLCTLTTCLRSLVA